MNTGLRVLCVFVLGGTLLGQAAIPDVRLSLIRTHMQVLADDRLEGRGTGTSAFQLAADYVADQFRALGLEPAFGGSYFQPVSVRQAVAVSEESSLHVRRGDVERRLVFGTDFVTSGDPHRTSVSFDAPLVFVGDGVSASSAGYDDYAGVDAAGKIVLIVLRSIPRLDAAQVAVHGGIDQRIEAAVAHGAAGFVMLSADDTFPWSANIQLASQGVWSVIGRDGVPLEPSKPVSVAVLRYQAWRDLFAMASMDYDDMLAGHRDRQLPAAVLPLAAAVRITSRHVERTSPNVGGVLRGCDAALRHEAVAFTAHLDHVGRGRPIEGDDIYNGAIDNASGVAAMLAMAQAASGRPRSRRSLLFLATTGEEMGHLGAKAFVASPAVALRDIVAAVNVDGPTLMLSPVERINAQGGASSTIGMLAAAAAQRLGLEIRQAPTRAVSDEAQFVFSGVPALWALADPATRNPGAGGVAGERRWMAEVYHSPKDDLNRPLDYGAAVTMAKFNLMVGLAAADGLERPRWHAGEVFAPAGR